MANRNFPNSRLYTFHVMPVAIDGAVIIGASGAVTSFSGLDIQAVTRLGTGIYQIQLKDNYNGLFGQSFNVRSPTTGSAVTAGSFVATTIYQITTLGTTNYNLIGVPAGITPTVGMSFVATGIGSGTGTATAIGNSNISAIETVGTLAGRNAQLNKQPFQANSGGYILFQTLAPTSSSVTTQIPTNPTSGCSIHFQFLLNNSSVQ